MEKEKNIYRETIKCPNCGCSNPAEIEKGTTIRQWRHYAKCFRCGCSLEKGWTE
jgi:uncharacterized paraquat-inducible protein A